MVLSDDQSGSNRQEVQKVIAELHSSHSSYYSYQPEYLLVYVIILFLSLSLSQYESNYKQGGESEEENQKISDSEEENQKTLKE